MLRKVFVFFMLAACPVMFSQTTWHWQNPLPQGNGLFRVKFINSTDAIAVGSSGTIMKTADAGLTWDITHYVTGSSKILKSLYFLDESNGWVGGYDGKLLHTTNGGVSWDSVTGHSNHIIQGISFPNPQKGSIATAFQNNICCASIFQTTNGGTSWNQRALPPDAQDNLYDLAFSNEQTGMAVGLFGLILRTTDGGVNWFQQSGATEEHLFSIDHVGDSLWFAAGNGRIIVKSTDAGATWSESFHGVTGDFEGIDMVDETTGYVCGDNGEIRKTTDGGLSWSLQQSGTTNLLYGISFADENTGIAVGYFGTILRTSDGGETWQVISEGTVQDLISVDFPENQTGFICGTAGTILKTTNLGQNWQILNSGISQTLYGISFPSVNVGTAVGENGKVIKTTNGGQNWFPQSSGVTGSGRLNSVSFVNESTGFAAGFNASSAGTIIKTTNGGSVWANVPTGITSLLFAIDFLNENYGIAVGGDGALIITTNSGSTWINKSLGFGNTLTSIQVVSDNFAVAAGFNFNVFPIPVIIVSTDGGETWVDRSNGITQLITKVFFANSSQGTAIGISGEIYRTTDGGLDWSFELSGTDNALNSVYMIDPDNIIITGRGGTILSSNPVVPVELSSFTGRAEGNQVVLQWKTSTETNNRGFEIQRRITSDEKGDNNFEKAGYLNGNGTSTEAHNYSFVDHNLEPGIYEYRLKQIDLDGSFEYSGLIEIKISQASGYSLEQNYPNPFNPSTMIKYSVPEPAKVELKVFDVLGREVRTLVNETKAAGNYQVRFDGDNISSGIYLVRIKAGEFIQTKAMTLLK